MTRTIHNFWMNCPIVACSEVFNLTVLTQHLTVCHGSPTCGVCKRELQYMKSWVKHVNQCAIKSTAPIQCPVDDCDETMTVLNRAEHCTRIHAYPKCKICPNEVSGFDNWVKHVNRCIRIHDTTSTRCPLDGCGARLTSLTRQEHYKTHHFAPFCLTCPAKIDVVNNWLKHIDSCNNRSFQSVRCTLCPSDVVVAVVVVVVFCWIIVQF